MPATCTLNQTDSIYCEFNVLNQTDSILWIQCFESNGVNTLNPILWIKRIQYAKSNGYRTGFTKSCTFSLLYADERKVTKTKSVPFQIMKTCVLQSLTRGISIHSVWHITHICGWKLSRRQLEKSMTKLPREQAWCDLKCTHHHPSRLPPHSLTRFTSTIISLFASSLYALLLERSRQKNHGTWWENWRGWAG